MQPYLDGVLSDEEVKEAWEHLAACPGCDKRYRFEQDLRHFVRVAVDETKGRVPVLAGTGYGTAIARDIAVGAEQAGADGLLLLPPYLMHSEQEGLAAHVEQHGDFLDATSDERGN